MARNYRRSNAGRAPRWLALKYAAPCKVCGRTIPAGDSAFYDYAARTATCHALECCQADGLTTSEMAWGSRELHDVRTAKRLGPGAPVPDREKRVIVTRFNSGAEVYRNARGRCIDAPCCGCCS